MNPIICLLTASLQIYPSILLKRRAQIGCFHLYLKIGLPPISWTVLLGRLGGTLVERLLELHWTPVPEVRMTAARIVEQADVVTDGRPGFPTRRPGVAMDQFFLQRGEKAFGHRVVPTISFPAHATGDPVLGQHRSVVVRRVLAPAIRV